MRDVIIYTVMSIGIDILSGLIKAFFTTGFNSTILRRGGKNKLGEMLAIVFAVFISKAQIKFNVVLGFDVVMIVCSYIFIMECVSIIENIGQLNDKAIPEKLRSLFEKLRDEEGTKK